MMTLLPDHFVLENVTQDDLVIASMAWGFTLGVGWLTTWTAMQQTRKAFQRRGWAILHNAYVIMIWFEILVCLSFGIICFMHLLGVIPPSFAFYFCILTLWALQVQFLLQIIINRCGILLSDYRYVFKLKWGVAALITAINISVYCIWVPARLQINPTYIHINEIWDRCEKGIYLVVDGCLNILFIRIVRRNLVENGLTKYKNLVNFNIFIIGFSLSMDVLIIAMMSLDNTFVYMQFHPLAYIVKLNIEMSMATLIAKIAKSTGTSDHAIGSSYDRSRSHGTRGNNPTGEGGNETGTGRGRFWGTVTTTVEMTTMKVTTPPDPKAQLGLAHADTDELISGGQYGSTSYTVTADQSHRNGRAGSSNDSTKSTSLHETI
ncbi:hypothetical protein S7711_01372 [Stachybotrys chartarum IBT 7711]|uniref:Transmembrane protein n=1 Tax=Stachybotrys chartarum (strain CBS 109288 / IBT 7711) TaxID=1280523 RepID=A0A084BBV9_STACB|nr:hypothetical protein S7711_01372 [Stachybotrys chartarum IBT 7711]KFA53745.1 hypothetical protein S40293_01613 [Stachybotrys chartarum IBT 40293]